MSVVTTSFNSAYLELIGMSNDAPADSFYSTSDYPKLQSLGPSLPKVAVPLPRTAVETQAAKTLTLSFKSIKPPYKFNTQLSNVPESISIYKLKNDLIESLPVLKEANIASSDIKFLVKGKVIADTSTLANLGDDISFMCMVSAPKPAESKPAPVDEDPLDDIADTVPVTTPSLALLLASTWQKIESVLIEDLGKESATIALSKLQTAFNK